MGVGLRDVILFVALLVVIFAPVFVWAHRRTKVDDGPLDALIRDTYRAPVLTAFEQSPRPRYSRTRRALAWIALVLIAALVTVCWYLGGV